VLAALSAVLAPFSVDYKSGGTGVASGAPSASACASAHASPAPAALAPTDVSQQGYSNQQQQQQQHDGRQYGMGQVMLTGPANDSYGGGGGDGNGGGYDGSVAPTVPIHRPRSTNLSGRPADRAHGPSPASSSSCQPGQCSTPDTCNPPAPAQAGTSSRFTSPRSISYHQQQWAYDEAQQQQRPGPGRYASADSTLTHATTDSSDYSSLGDGGSFDSQQGATPSSGLMHSPPLQPVHLQRPVFGAPSPYQASDYGYDDDGRSSFPSLSGYSFPLPSPLPDLALPSSPQQLGQQQRAMQQQQYRQSYRQPPPPMQPLVYGSYGTCDVEDLVGGRPSYVQQKVEQKSPDLSRLGATYGPPPPILPPPLATSRSGPLAYMAPPPTLPPVQPHPPASLTTVEETPSGGATNQGEQTAFISKLWHLLTHAEYERYLRWNTAGDAFILTNGNEFAMKVLPRFYRHSNVASFVRQLHIYSFTRVSTIRLLVRPPAEVSADRSLS
jgi:hypothetical protein